MDIPYTVERREDTGLYNAKLGVWLFLASEVMLFGALVFLLHPAARRRRCRAPGRATGWITNSGAVNTIILIISSVTNVVAWANLKLGSFNKYRFYQAITIVCAVAFLSIKSYEYYGKFHHYTITLKDGRIADGHIQKAETTKDKVVIDGWWPASEAAVMDPPAQHRGEENRDRDEEILLTCRITARRATISPGFISP